MTEPKKSIVFIKTVGEYQNIKLHPLNPDDKLPDIRKELEKYNTINDMLSFSKKFPKKNNDGNDEFGEVERKIEDLMILREILDGINNDNESESGILYLMKNSKPGWKGLNEKFRLDYGRMMSFDGIKIANRRAFVMKDCELKEITAKSYNKYKVIFKSKEDWMKKTNLFVNADVDDINVNRFIKLGISSVETPENENFREEIRATYSYTELGKASLKFNKKNLELTDDFKNDLKLAISSKDLREFRKIIKEYGQFIPTEIIFGGRVYSHDIKKSLRKSKSKFYIFDHMRLLGGKNLDGINFDERAWIESLKDYQNWDCIEFKNPISIFQLLPDNLRREVFKSIGKRVLYAGTEDCVCQFASEKPMVHKLKYLPENISEILQNKEADCDIFATVIDTENLKEDFFNCQILSQRSMKPWLIIHNIQRNYQYRNRTLKIMLMVFGYDIDFNAILFDVPSVSVKLEKNDYDSRNPGSLNRKMLQLEHELALSDTPFLGIPVLKSLDSSNEYLIIGHNFFDVQKSNRIGSHAFSYCLKNNFHANLPSFTFYTFIFLDKDNITTSPCTLEFSTFKKRPFINLERISSPIYVSFYLSKNNYIPFFLNQSSRRISIEYVDCSNKHCLICREKLLKIARNNDIKIITFNSNISGTYNHVV